MATEDEVAAALRTAIEAQLASLIDDTDVLEADEHKGIKDPHVQLAVAERPGERERAGRQSKRGYRVDTRVVADTVGTAREIRQRVHTALLGKRLVIDGQPTTPIHLESQDSIAPDEKLLSGLTTWTFVHGS